MGFPFSFGQCEATYASKHITQLFPGEEPVTIGDWWNVYIHILTQPPLAEEYFLAHLLFRNPDTHT